MPKLSEVKPNVFQSLDVRTKGVMLLSMLCLALLFDDPRFNFIVFLIAAGIAFLAQLSWTKVRQTLFPILPLFLLIVIFAGFSSGNLHFQQERSQTVLLEVWPAFHLNITYGGLYRGITYLLRMLILILSSMTFLQTTSLEKLTQLLQKLKVPAQFSFMIMTAIRFIPVLNRKRILILEAQKARGAHIPEKGAFVPIRTFLPLVVPLFAGSIQMANTLSMAMMSRGFGYTRYQTHTDEFRFRIRDGVVIGLEIILIVLGLYLRIVLKLGKL
ncbi:energy-coupling factor transporter transmembrane component T [Desulfitobacterium sp.]|uniref:energy-coupling factor transporter transmembrane component T family protein n=1 Tax=Desulfitobacterium sp. TaxID=49981 RepID=UPI002D1C7991|nr:energy-coupling factor transporter transmembrane component T [Desulfitobacterium sp.]HVJ47620.1 energy-coupling factor transporter transmembrane component T [Desulfitobacterium sp.]